jgi:hypothetical protein
MSKKTSECKKRAEYLRAYRNRNREKIREYDRQYYAVNKEKIKQQLHLRVWSEACFVTDAKKAVSKD